MIIRKTLKEIAFEYDTEAQTLKIETLDRKGNNVLATGSITLNKVYMFSTAIFIAQVMRRQFIRKQDLTKLAKYKEEHK